MNCHSEIPTTLIYKSIIPLSLLLLLIAWLVLKPEKIAKVIDKVDKSPIVLDLNGDGIATTNLKDFKKYTNFDHDKNGLAEKTSWINDKDGFLVRDLNHNGEIDDGGEMFSSETLLQDGKKAANGYQALAELDDNGDDQIDADDQAYSVLKIWKDTYDYGQVNKNELLDLNSLGIKSIAVDYTITNQTDANGNITKQISTFKKTDNTSQNKYFSILLDALNLGSTGTSASILFQIDKTYTVETEFLPETAEVAALPELGGHGTIHSLRQTMLRDKTKRLQHLVQQFVKEKDPSVRHELMLPIMYVWAGVENIDPLSRSNAIYGNGIEDARKVAYLEALLGDPYLGTLPSGERDPNPYGDAAKMLLDAFEGEAYRCYKELIVRTHFKYLFDSIKAVSADKKGALIFNVDSTEGLLETIYNTEKNNIAIIKDFVFILKLHGGTGESILKSLRAAGDSNATGFKGVLARMGLDSPSVTADKK